MRREKINKNWVSGMWVLIHSMYIFSWMLKNYNVDCSLSSCSISAISKESLKGVTDLSFPHPSGSWLPRSLLLRVFISTTCNQVWSVLSWELENASLNLLIFNEFFNLSSLKSLIPLPLPPFSCIFFLFSNKDTVSLPYSQRYKLVPRFEREIWSNESQPQTSV